MEDDEYAKLVRRMNPPRVVIDNDSCDHATVIRVDRVKKHGVLLEAVRVLVDLNLVITKAYISSDGNWFMDVFNVTDRDGNKLQDKEIIDYIQKCLEEEDCLLPPASSSGTAATNESTIIELTGTDRPGLLSEVCAVLTALGCNIVKAEVWTHNKRAAAIVQITDDATGQTINDTVRLSRIQELLCNVMQGDSCCSSKKAKIAVSMGLTHTERRLHQLMLDDQDYCEQQHGPMEGEEKSKMCMSKPQVGIMDCTEKCYTVVILRCKDRPKLLFDTLCVLTDMQYVVFHGTVDAGTNEAYQEYYIRHIDGHPVRSESERNHLIRCLEAAIERRASDGLELELRTEDRVGLLSETTRVFRENSLCIIRAVISTKDGKAEDTFYVSDTAGNPVDDKTMDSVRAHLGHAAVRVKQSNSASAKPLARSNAGTILCNFLRGCSFQSFRLIRSYS